MAGWFGFGIPLPKPLMLVVLLVEGSIRRSIIAFLPCPAHLPMGCFCYMQSGYWGFALLVLNPQVFGPQQHHSVGVLLVSFVSSCIHIQRRSQSRAHLGPVFDLGPSYLLKISYLWLWSHRQTSFQIATWNQVRKKEDTWRSS